MFHFIVFTVGFCVQYRERDQNLDGGGRRKYLVFSKANTLTYIFIKMFCFEELQYTFCV